MSKGTLLAVMRAMELPVHLRYPRSFFKLLSIGFLLAVAPLALSLVMDTVAIGRLASQSRQAVFNAARIAHGSRQLVESVPSLERAALQGLVLRDAALWQGYDERHKKFASLSVSLAKLPLDGDTRKLLDKLVRDESALDQKLRGEWGSKHRSMTPAQVSLSYQNVVAQSHQLLTKANEGIDREAENLRAKASATESRAWLQLAIVLPVALFLVAGFSYLLAKPIAQLEEGIRGLGERKFDTPIQVEGPQDLEQLGQQLDWLRRRLAQLEEQKSRFLRHVSHELKTPLTALREGSELLVEGVVGPLAPRQQEIAGILRDNSLHLQYLIEDLLRHGEAEFQQTALRIQPLRPRDVMALVAEKQRVAREARQIALHLEGGDFLMYSDTDRLRVILDNLLSNAIKYAPANSAVSLTATEEGDRVRLRILDEGSGIAPEDRERVFDPFFRGAIPAGGAVQGTGLGLSICRDHVQALGGTIEIGTGRGDFSVFLPKGEQ
ncbi:MAG TPA: HAMP domain-containing sensor histidine kinase [Rhodocyclaceae bacterium]|nr:HAMP domain-containing sensor histidine kinase [Rhodocyclaceae bacterium]